MNVVLLGAYTLPKPRFLSGNNFLIFLCILGIALLFFYRYVYRQEARHARRLTRGQVLRLWALRIIVAILALIALAQPAIDQSLREVRRPVVALVVDVSKSMDFPSSLGDVFVDSAPRERQTRFDSAQAMVQQLHPEFSRTHRTKVYLFSDTLRLLRELPQRESDRDPVEPRSKVFDPALRAADPHSNPVDAIQEVLRENAAEELSAIVMLSDFRRTGGADWREHLDAVKADKAANRKVVPIHTLPIGTEFPLRDLRIDDVIAPPEANVGDVLTFTVKIVNQIDDILKTKLSLFEEGKKADEWKLASAKELRLPRGESSITISTIPDILGPRKFKLHLPPEKEEVNLENNQAIVSVEIVKRDLRVILIAGKPTIEYMYLVPALLRDPVIKVACYLQSADVDYIQQGNMNIDRLPKTLQEWQNFDVAILDDVDPNGINVQQLAGLDAMVTKGGGLVFIAGRNHGLAKLVQVHAARIRSLLPVEVDKNLFPDYDQQFESSFGTVRTPAGRGHPIMFCSGDEAMNERLWATFPRFFWHHPVQGAKTGAVVLLKREEGGPDGGAVLMAIQRYTEGAVFYCGINSLWRWRYPFESFEYDRFWNRVIRYLGETRLRGGQQQVAIETDRRSYGPGERVKITLRVLDPALMKQLAGEPVYVAVTSPSKVKQMVKLLPRIDQTPAYDGYYQASTVGITEILARQIAPDADTQEKPLFEKKHHFEVKMQSLEDKDTSADLKAAEDLAAATGGQCLTYKNIRRAEDINLVRTKTSVAPQILEKEITLEIWDGLKFLMLFIVLISTEWCLRKWWGLL